MSLTNPPSGASGPASASARNQTLKRSVQAAFEGKKESDLDTGSLVSIIGSFLSILLSVVPVCCRVASPSNPFYPTFSLSICHNPQAPKSPLDWWPSDLFNFFANAAPLGSFHLTSQGLYIGTSLFFLSCQYLLSHIKSFPSSARAQKAARTRQWCSAAVSTLCGTLAYGQGRMTRLLASPLTPALTSLSP